MLVTSLLISMCLSSPQLERPELTITQGYIEGSMNRNARVNMVRKAPGR